PLGVGAALLRIRIKLRRMAADRRELKARVVEQAANPLPLGCVSRHRVQAERRAGDQGHAGVAGLPHDRYLLVYGQLAHRPAAKPKPHLAHDYPLTPDIVTPSTKNRWPTMYSRKIGSRLSVTQAIRMCSSELIWPENWAITSVSGRSSFDCTTINGQRYM